MTKDTQAGAGFCNWGTSNHTGSQINSNTLGAEGSFWPDGKEPRVIASWGGAWTALMCGPLTTWQKPCWVWNTCTHGQGGCSYQAYVPCHAGADGSARCTPVTSGTQTAEVLSNETFAQGWTPTQALHLPHYTLYHGILMTHESPPLFDGKVFRCYSLKSGSLWRRRRKSFYSLVITTNQRQEAISSMGFFLPLNY